MFEWFLIFLVLAAVMPGLVHNHSHRAGDLRLRNLIAAASSSVICCWTRRWRSYWFGFCFWGRTDMYLPWWAWMIVFCGFACI